MIDIPIPLSAIAIILCIHWYADFFCQTNWQATNKSHNNKAFTSHVVSYFSNTWIFLAIAAHFTLIHADKNSGWYWIGLLTYPIVNAILHWITDYFTSRLNSKLWKKGMEQGNLHNFFVAVGADQLIHYFCLFGTLYIMAMIS